MLPKYSTRSRFSKTIKFTKKAKPIKSNKITSGRDRVVKARDLSVMDSRDLTKSQRNPARGLTGAETSERLTCGAALLV